MRIGPYSTALDSILALPASTPSAEVAEESESRLVVRLETQSPALREVQDFLSGNVPEQGSHVVELIHKMIF